ncbi:MAG: thiamine phosphate synthase, partial [Clostridia bacterium]|nr:thiamine phosphate synthase [Clostridia bacterium]
TDSTGWSEDDFLHKIEEALRGGVTMLQLREKDKSTKDYIAYLSSTSLLSGAFLHYFYR